MSTATGAFNAGCRSIRVSPKEPGGVTTVRNLICNPSSSCPKKSPRLRAHFFIGERDGNYVRVETFLTDTVSYAPVVKSPQTSCRPHRAGSRGFSVQRVGGCETKVTAVSPRRGTEPSRGPVYDALRSRL